MLKKQTMHALNIGTQKSSLLPFENLRFNKRADMSSSQIFIYIISLVVVSLILLYGFSAITKQIAVSKELEQLQFRKTLESHVASYANDFGSVGNKKLIAPTNMEKICFTDFYSIKQNTIPCNNEGTPATVRDSFEGLSSTNPAGAAVFIREKKNVFLFSKEGDLIESYYAGNISVARTPPGSECNILCINQSRQLFLIKLVGKGNHVQISQN